MNKLHENIVKNAPTEIKPLATLAAGIASVKGIVSNPPSKQNPNRPDWRDSNGLRELPKEWMFVTKSDILSQTHIFTGLNTKTNLEQRGILWSQCHKVLCFIAENGINMKHLRKEWSPEDFKILKKAIILAYGAKNLWISECVSPIYRPVGAVNDTGPIDNGSIVADIHDKNPPVVLGEYQRFPVPANRVSGGTVLISNICNVTRTSARELHEIIGEPLIRINYDSPVFSELNEAKGYMEAIYPYIHCSPETKETKEIGRTDQIKMPEWHPATAAHFFRWVIEVHEEYGDHIREISDIIKCLEERGVTVAIPEEIKAQERFVSLGITNFEKIKEHKDELFPALDTVVSEFRELDATVWPETMEVENEVLYLHYIQDVPFVRFTSALSVSSVGHEAESYGKALEFLKKGIIQGIVIVGMGKAVTSCEDIPQSWDDEIERAAFCETRYLIAREMSRDKYKYGKPGDIVACTWLNRNRVNPRGEVPPAYFMHVGDGWLEAVYDEGTALQAQSMTVKYNERFKKKEKTKEAKLAYEKMIKEASLATVGHIFKHIPEYQKPIVQRAAVARFEEDREADYYKDQTDKCWAARKIGERKSRMEQALYDLLNEMSGKWTIVDKVVNLDQVWQKTQEKVFHSETQVIGEVKTVEGKTLGEPVLGYARIGTNRIFEVSIKGGRVIFTALMDHQDYIHLADGGVIDVHGKLAEQAGLPQGHVEFHFDLASPNRVVGLEVLKNKFGSN